MKASDDIDYFKVHAWLIYHYGRANKCENPNCEYPNPKRFEWAVLKGEKAEKNRERFIMLCPSCHRKYDLTDEVRAKLSNGRKGKAAVNKRRVRLNQLEVYDSLTDASRATGVSISSIANNLGGLSKTTKVGKWDYVHQN